MRGLLSYHSAVNSIRQSSRLQNDRLQVQFLLTLPKSRLTNGPRGNHSRHQENGCRRTIPDVLDMCNTFHDTLVMPKQTQKQRDHYIENRGRIRAQQKAYRAENIEKCRALNREWSRTRGTEIRRENGVLPREEWHRIVARDPIQKIWRKRLYNRTNWTLHSKGKWYIGNLVGCPGPQFRRHLEVQFTEGMSWENYGVFWEIDHFRPLASFDLSDPAQYRRCAHYSNTRPITVNRNNRRAFGMTKS